MSTMIPMRMHPARSIWHVLLANSAAATGLSAWVVAAAVAAQVIEVDVPSLPAAIDIVVVLAAPLTVTARMASTENRHTALAALLTGALLLVWVGTELPLLGCPGWVRAALTIAGAAILATGLILTVFVRDRLPR